MAAKTKIEWTDATWNPAVGCTKVSAGCAHCYAERIAARFRHHTAYVGTTVNGRWSGQINLRYSALDEPLRWRIARRVFVCSMGDPFHHAVPDDYIDRMWGVMALCPEHLFLVLTKRPERMAEYTRTPDRRGRITVLMNAQCKGKPQLYTSQTEPWPLPNVVLGTSIENQPAADERLPHLSRCRAPVLFVSCEPLLEEIDLSPWIDRLGWVIVGSESGQRARPMDEDWVRLLRNQCVEAGVPFFYKQRRFNGMTISTPDLDGRQWTEMPRLEKGE